MVVSELDNEYNPSSSVQSEKMAGKDRIGRTILATFIAALGPLSFGYCLGYSSSAVVDLKEPNMSSAVRLTSAQGSWFSVSLMSRARFSTAKFARGSFTCFNQKLVVNVLHCKLKVVVSKKIFPS